jgi:hypothetical protein
MSKTVLPIIAELFAAEKPSGRMIPFEWRLIRRKHRPFLLLPAATMDVRMSLELYSAQRRRAKIWRALLPPLFRTPLAGVFTRFSFAADAGSEVIRFISAQSGVPAEQLRSPAIKFGGLALHKARLVLLVGDATNRPVKVIKLGLNAEGRVATEREADLLEKLPPNTLGCIRVTDRLTTPKISAFATAYFPGDNPLDDAGMENLFNAWLNPEPAVPLASLESWRELEAANPAAWPAVRAALAGKTVRSTLHHGDFAPWNIRAINSQNLQAFDWERGNLRGVPGWDWFHFIVQTSILARRHSVERVAAEVEELFQSPRFETYAAAASIGEIVKPLLLAYLLHHRWVIKPLEGGNTTAELGKLLADRWGFTLPVSGAEYQTGDSVPAAAPLSLWADARQQLQSAWAQLANIFWEPTLTANPEPSFWLRLRYRWPVALLSLLWLAAVGNTHYLYLNHQMLLPIYGVPCLLATWKMGRRWGAFFAIPAAAIGPVLVAIREPSTHPVALVCWNSVMRFFILQMAVFLMDRIHRQKNFFQRLTVIRRQPASFADNWAVVVVSSLIFFLVAWGDLLTGPRVNFLPLYLVPAMLATLFLNLRWGTLMVLLASGIACADEYISKYNASFAQVFGWNLIMRFLILFLVILLLDRVRQQSVLFPPRKPNGHATGAKPT